MYTSGNVFCALTLDQLLRLLKEGGCVTKLADKSTRPHKVSTDYLIVVENLPWSSFVLFSDKENKENAQKIELLEFYSLFRRSEIFDYECVNLFNSLPQRGRLSIQPDGTVAYHQHFSLIGGITPLNFLDHVDFWREQTTKCQELIGAAEKTAIDVKKEIARIFGKKK